MFRLSSRALLLSNHPLHYSHDLSSWITGEMDVTGKDANFLIKSIFVGGYSYVDVKSASM